MTPRREHATCRWSRREFLAAAGAGMSTLTFVSHLATGWELAGPKKLHVATNLYPWITFYRRENKDFMADLDAGLAEVAAAGLDGFEPILNTRDDLDRLEPVLKKHGLEMRSFYVNTVLHDQEQAEKSIVQVVALAEEAHRRLGTRIVVTNPMPLTWNRQSEQVDKSDEQLEIQAEALNRLGAALRERGLKLAYHNHDMELRQAAREFHHMMLATQPENVTLCLDAHWLYRGTGNSQVAMFDLVKLYGSRVSEIHLRQSQNGIWTEVFGPGDIDYPRLARELRAAGVQPHLVLEQAVEQGSPQTMSAREAHQKGRLYIDEVFRDFLGS